MKDERKEPAPEAVVSVSLSSWNKMKEDNERLRKALATCKALLKRTEAERDEIHKQFMDSVHDGDIS
jgi:hypothetical protein